MNLVRIQTRNKNSTDRDRCCALLPNNRICNELTAILFTDDNGDSFGLCNRHWEEDAKRWEIDDQFESSITN